MKRTTICLGVLLLAFMMLASSCHRKSAIVLSTDHLVFTYSGGSDVFQVTADCKWTITDAPDWMTINPTSGKKNDIVNVRVSRNNTSEDRNALLSVVSSNEKTKKDILITQTPIDISALVKKVWFARTEERWNSDYYDVVIPESYRSWTYYADAGREQWFFYFLEDSTGYEIHVFNNDTVFFQYQYIYEPDFDSLYIGFELINDTVNKEDYHTVVHQLDNEYFVFSHAYRPHQFEKITAVNVTGDRKNTFRINPKKIKQKSRGPLIEVK